MKRIISIIGSGFGGLAAACRLAQQGHQVSIYEKAARPGGKAAGIEIEGIPLDSAPTILRMPHLLEDIFAGAPEQIRARLKLVRMETHYRFYQTQQGSFFDVSANKADTVMNLAHFNTEDARRYSGYLAQCQQFFQSSFRKSPQQPARSIKKFFNQLQPDSNQPSIFHKSFYHFNEGYFTNPDVISAFSFYPLFFGQNPLTVSEHMAMVHAMEQQWGITYPLGGMRGLITLLKDYFEYLGGHLFLNSSVSEILVENQRIHGLRLDDGAFIQTDYIISNLSPYQTTQLMQQGKQQSKPVLKNFGSSYVLLHFITHKLPMRSKLQLHSIINPPNFQQTVQEIFNKRKFPASPWLYFHIPSLVDETSFPAEMDVVNLVCPVPNLFTPSQAQKSMRTFRDRILVEVEKFLPSFSKSIVNEKITTPTNLQENYSMVLGTNYQPLRAPDIEGLLFVGESSWRGLGLVGVLSSAEEAAKSIPN